MCCSAAPGSRHRPGGPGDGAPVQPLCRIARLDRTTRCGSGGAAAAHLCRVVALSAPAPHAFANMALPLGRRPALTDLAALAVDGLPRARGPGGELRGYLPFVTDLVTGDTART